jgi:SAM-dependent methyltransferase
MKPYLPIVDHYERCLAEHGDTHRGVDWPRHEDVDTRYDVMLGVIRPDDDGPVRLLDVGCGAGHLYDYMQRREIRGIAYEGLDISRRFVELCRSKYPTVPFHCVDVLEPAAEVPACDYAVLNGVFTEKLSLSFAEMLAYFQAVISAVFARVNKGLAFNVMSKQVDWEREDLFHLSCDELARFLCGSLSRHFVFRHDYGLYEYTTYLYREPRPWPA